MLRDRLWTWGVTTPQLCDFHFPDNSHVGGNPGDTHSPLQEEVQHFVNLKQSLL